MEALLVPVLVMLNAVKHLHAGRLGLGSVPAPGMPVGAAVPASGPHPGVGDPSLRSG